MSADLTVTDLKQWAYCKRIVYYQKLMPHSPPRTYKMESGRKQEPETIVLERRRTLKRYDLPDGERRFGVRLYSSQMDLGGTIDLLIESGPASWPVDFKRTGGGLRENHTWQLAGYALLLAERGRRVEAGFVQQVPDGQVWRVEMTTERLAIAREAIVAMQEMIRQERLPDATEVRARCEECEWRNFCGDIW